MNNPIGKYYKISWVHGEEIIKVIGKDQFGDYRILSSEDRAHLYITAKHLRRIKSIPKLKGLLELGE